MKTNKNNLIVWFLTAGISSYSAFVAYDLTLPSEGLRTEAYLDPDHALHTQDADDKDKAFTIRIPVKQTID